MRVLFSQADPNGVPVNLRLIFTNPLGARITVETDIDVFEHDTTQNRDKEWKGVEPSKFKILYDYKLDIGKVQSERKGNK